MIFASDSTSHKEWMNSCKQVENVVGGPSAEKRARNRCNIAGTNRFEAVKEQTVIGNYIQPSYLVQVDTKQKKIAVCM